MTAGHRTEPRRTDDTTARSRAVVFLSGVLSYSPFTTPDAACTDGLAAGSTDTYLRRHLLDHGIAVFTAPQRAGSGVVEETDDPFIGPFGGCPPQLPESMTVDTTATIDRGGRRLQAFVSHLHDEYDITDIDLVGHSMGGLLARALIGILATGGPVVVRSLTTIGTPWETPMVTRIVDPAQGDTSDADRVASRFAAEIVAARPGIDALLKQTGRGFAPWAESLAGTLERIPVTLIGGSRFTLDGGDPAMWPHDGAIQLAAATAANVPAAHLPDRRVHVLPLTHSVATSTQAGLPPETALTWNPDVGSILVEFLRSVGWP